MCASSSPLVSIVIPVFRNEDTLRPLHARLEAVLGARDDPYEIVFVDDSSPDGSAAVLAALAGAGEVTRVVTLRANAGQQWAVLAGLSVARGAWCVILDADLQDRPESVALLLDAVRDDVGVVTAGRRGKFQSWWRMVTSRLFKGLLALATGLPADAGIFMALRRDVIERALALRTTRPHVLTLVGCTGAPSISVPVRRDPREGGASAYSATARVRAGIRALGCLLDGKAGRGGPSVAEQLVPMVSGDVGADNVAEHPGSR